MNAPSHPIDTRSFLIGLLGGFALVALLAPGVSKAPGILGGMSMLFLGLGGWLIGKAVRRFSSWWKQGVAVAGVVVAWYSVFILLGSVRPELFGY